MITEERARDLLHGAADGYAADAMPPLSAIVRDGLAGRRRASRRRLAAVVGGSVAVLAALASVVAIPRVLTDSAGPTSSPTTAPSDWREIYGPELADALGLEPVANGDVDSTPSCQHTWVAGFTQGKSYCVLPEDYGITDPVDGYMLILQLQGVPPSPQLPLYARLVVEMRRVQNRQPFVDADFARLRSLHDQIEELRDEVLPPGW